MTVKAVLFDIDGTLVDSNDFHVRAWQQAFAAAGHQFDNRAIHDQIGKGADMLVPALLPKASETEHKRLGEEQAAIFKREFLGQVKPFPSAHDLLTHVHNAGQKVVLASSALHAELEHYIDSSETQSRFDLKRPYLGTGHARQPSGT